MATAKSNKPDSNLFSGFKKNTDVAAPVQKIVPVPTSSTIGKTGVNFKVPNDFKKTIDLYLVHSEMTLKDFFIIAATEYIDNHKIL